MGLTDSFIRCGRFRGSGWCQARQKTLDLIGRPVPMNPSDKEDGKGSFLAVSQRKAIDRANYDARESIINSVPIDWMPFGKVRLHLAIALGPKYYDGQGTTTDYWAIVKWTGRLRKPEKYLNPDAMTALIVRMRLEGF